MTIYELDNEIAKILDEVEDFMDAGDGNVVNTETGEVITFDAYSELCSRLDGLAEKRDEKISNIACWIKQLEADAEAIKKEKMNLAKRQKSCENKAESLKNYLNFILQGEKFKDARVNISYRTSKTVEFKENYDYSRLPDKYQKITYEPRKTEIKEALLAGEEIDGVWIQENKNISIK